MQSGSLFGPRRGRALRVCLPAALIAALVAAHDAQATDASSCADICPGTGACTINTAKTIAPGADLDCSGRNITITGNGSLKVTDGDFVLRANDLVMTGSGSTIYVFQSSNGVRGEIDIELTGSALIEGKIRSNGPRGGGAIHLQAGGNITIAESGTDGIECDGTAADASGGEILVEAGGSVVVNDPIHAEGSFSGINRGGTIEIRAGGSVATGIDGHVSAPGRMNGGGTVSMVSRTSNITLLEHIDVSGRGDDGDGGQIHLEAGGGVTVGAAISAGGGAGATGGLSSGGSVTVDAGCGGVAVNANIDVAGGDPGVGGSAGSVRVDTRGAVAFASAVVIDAHARANGGRGGTIAVRSRSSLIVGGQALLDVHGDTANGHTGDGGTAVLSACTLDVASTATLEATGYHGGEILLYGQKTPPQTGVQPLVVHDGAVLHAFGATADNDGTITLRAHSVKEGSCSNDTTLACRLDTDCTVGCQTGDCLYANPDSDGKTTQFDVTAMRSGAPGLGDDCSAQCL